MRRHVVVIALVLNLAGCAIRADQMPPAWPVYLRVPVAG
jgi:hypothetical protein